jgi:hypothetical protein
MESSLNARDLMSPTDRVFPDMQFARPQRTAIQASGDLISEGTKNAIVTAKLVSRGDPRYL